MLVRWSAPAGTARSSARARGIAWSLGHEAQPRHVHSRQLWQASIFGGPAPVFKRANRHEEQGILNACLQALRLHPRVAWVMRMNSGGHKIDGRFIRYGFKGMPDILGQMRDGRIIMIEVKGPRGHVTVDQYAALETVCRHGGVAGVAYSGGAGARDCRESVAFASHGEAKHAG